MKRLFTLALVLGATLTLPATALAHGHGRRQAAKTVSYAVCSIEDCTSTAEHQHDGVTYCAHYAGDGHTYHNATSNGCGGHGRCH